MSAVCTLALQRHTAFPFAYSLPFLLRSILALDGEDKVRQAPTVSCIKDSVSLSRHDGGLFVHNVKRIVGVRQPYGGQQLPPEFLSELCEKPSIWQQLFLNSEFKDKCPPDLVPVQMFMHQLNSDDGNRLEAVYAWDHLLFSNTLMLQGNRICPCTLCHAHNHLSPGSSCMRPRLSRSSLSSLAHRAFLPHLAAACCRHPKQHGQTLQPGQLPQGRRRRSVQGGAQDGPAAPVGHHHGVPRELRSFTATRTSAQRGERPQAQRPSWPDSWCHHRARRGRAVYARPGAQQRQGRGHRHRSWHHRYHPRGSRQRPQRHHQGKSSLRPLHLGCCLHPPQ